MTILVEAGTITQAHAANRACSKRHGGVLVFSGADFREDVEQRDSASLDRPTTDAPREDARK